ncbi:MAG: SMP-30/gluconolactonase/LRE family protein [Deltaproteobacteria bacterium]|nr:MAG: SMP-30/gluconolactonase/LRE family protein [Deltaproteobacteria bacterium]
MALETNVLLQGLAFGEGPRWHEGRLWFSDMHAHVVRAVDLDGKAENIVEVPNRPSGLGWLPDGRLLVVSMVDRRLLRLDPEGLVEVADLGELTGFHCNDMVVDRAGRAYVGNFGFDLESGEEPRSTTLVLVTPAGEARVVADDLMFPNGAVITPDGSTLIVAESFAGRLSAFDIQPDGGLKARRVWAAVDGMVPDGICLDAEGAIWVASPLSGEVLRVHEGGDVSERFRPKQAPYACMLGSPDRRTLFVLTAPTHLPEEAIAKRAGCIETVAVRAPGAGLP